MKHNYENQIDDEEVVQSKYNSGMLKIGRLNICWMNCSNAWRNADLSRLGLELDLGWLELEADSRKEDQEVMLNLDKSISHSKGNNKWFTLKKKWIALLRIEKGQGLGKAYHDDSEDELT